MSEKRSGRFESWARYTAGLLMLLVVEVAPCAEMESRAGHANGGRTLTVCLLFTSPGDGCQRHANLRTLYAYQVTRPGKKLKFMGTEFAKGKEWNSCGVLN